MDLNNAIAGMATAMSQQNLSMQVSTAVAKKSLDNQKEEGNAIMSLLNSAAGPMATEATGKGGTVNLFT
ncbi:MAG: YjfB family protein [Deltaproteobacteria bacterium]|nr:YjfB family protein [Deltaproteobacteria bacterium]